jgi:hypothetical protein
VRNEPSSSVFVEVVAKDEMKYGAVELLIVKLPKNVSELIMFCVKSETISSLYISRFNKVCSIKSFLSRETFLFPCIESAIRLYLCDIALVIII